MKFESIKITYKDTSIEVNGVEMSSYEETILKEIIMKGIEELRNAIIEIRKNEGSK